MEEPVSQEQLTMQSTDVPPPVNSTVDTDHGVNQKPKTETDMDGKSEAAETSKSEEAEVIAEPVPAKEEPVEPVSEPEKQELPAEQEVEAVKLESDVPKEQDIQQEKQVELGEEPARVEPVLQPPTSLQLPKEGLLCNSDVNQKSPNAEIEKGSIKEQLHEIISEIEKDIKGSSQSIEKEGAAKPSAIMDKLSTITTTTPSTQPSASTTADTTNTKTADGISLFRVNRFSVGDGKQGKIWTPSTDLFRRSEPTTVIGDPLRVNESLNTQQEKEAFAGPEIVPVADPSSKQEFAAPSQNAATDVQHSENKENVNEPSLNTPAEISVNQERRVSFEKLMQPANDAILMTSKGRKMFGSSSFYNEPKNIYPTVEEQFELARRISESLSAEDNVTSKGQTMYVKRKKRSVKWITESPDRLNEPPPLVNSTTTSLETYCSDQTTETTNAQPKPASSQDFDTNGHPKKPSLKFVLNPVQMRDALSLRNSPIYNDHAKLSPEFFSDLVKDLNSPTGKGAQLFAKRKKKAEKWIVDKTTVRSNPAGESDEKLEQAIVHRPVFPISQYPPPATHLGHLSIIERNNEIEKGLHQLNVMNTKAEPTKSPWGAASETWPAVNNSFVAETPAAAPIQPFFSPAAPHPPIVMNRTLDDSAVGTSSAGEVRMRQGRPKDKAQRPYSMREHSYDPVFNCYPKGWDRDRAASNQSKGIRHVYAPGSSQRQQPVHPERSVHQEPAPIAAFVPMEPPRPMEPPQMEPLPTRLNTTMDEDARKRYNRRSIADFGNYNTMPRGWGRLPAGYYKPIKADELKSFIVPSM